jgi:hypothetical protein
MPRVEAQRGYIAAYARLRRKLHEEDELPKLQDLLLDNVIATRHRKRWLEDAHEPRSLTPFKTPYFTTLYPDQLTAEMAAEYGLFGESRAE